MIKAYRLTGIDGHSRMEIGNVDDKLIEAKFIHFKETPAHAVFEWHTAPTSQFVITLSGVLELTTKTEKFILRPGEILLVLDVTGSGHQWRLINNEPWRRAYVIFEEGIDIPFITRA